MSVGMLYTVTDTTTTARTISEYINNISAIDVQLLYRFGMNNEQVLGANNKYWRWANHKVEWLEDEALATTDQLAEALDDSETGIDVDDGTKFAVGDLIMVDDEIMWVSAKASANTLTVTRGAAGTTAATHLDNATVTIVSEARLEGADEDDDVAEWPSVVYNYSQIFNASIKMSGSELYASERYGVSPIGNKEYHYNKFLGGASNAPNQNAGELMRRLQNTFYYGSRVQRTSTVPGQMGGAAYYISTNDTDASSASLSFDLIADEMEAIYNAGGMPDVIVTSYKQKRYLNALFSGQIMRERNDRVGGSLIDTLLFEGFELDVIVDRHCPNDELYILDSSKCGWLTLRPWDEYEIAKTGDSEKWGIVGEFGFYLANEKAHARLHTLATS